MPLLRLGSGTVVTLVIAVLAVFGMGAVASAEPAQQAATPTPAPAVTAAQSPSCVNTQGTVLILSNPQPGDTLLSGVPVNMSGIAYDPAADTGSGIANVTVYLGARDAGGTSLGTASLGLPNPAAAPGSQFATAGFTLRTSNLPTGTGGRTIYVYARSSVTNMERVLQVPIYLNTAPTPVKGAVPTAVLPTAPACTPTAVPTATPTAPPAPPAVPATPVAGAPTVASVPTLAPIPTLALPAAGGAAPAPAAPAAPAPPAAAAAPAAPAAVAPATAPASAQTTAPRGGGIPSELGFGLVTAGAAILAGGIALRRRQRRGAAHEEASSSVS